VSEGIQEPGTEEALPELSERTVVDEAAPLEPQPSIPAPLPDRTISWLRLAYAFEFLLAVIAILALWSEVGGQGHLDLMPWYTKLACVAASAWCCVRFTAGLVEERNIWSRRTVVWLAGLILVGATMAAVTYYYHLHEEPGDSDSDDTTATAVTATQRPRILQSLAE